MNSFLCISQVDLVNLNGSKNIQLKIVQHGFFFTALMYLFSVAKKIPLGSVTKQFFSCPKFFSCNKKIFLTARKNLLSRKKILGQEKTCF